MLLCYLSCKRESSRSPRENCLFMGLLPTPTRPNGLTGDDAILSIFLIN